MSAIFHDPLQFEMFRALAPPNPSAGPTDLKVDILSFFHQNPEPTTRTIPVTDLASLPQAPLQIIFAPLDDPDQDTEGLVWLFQFYSFPSAFLAERIKSVTHSFGSFEDKNGHSCSWLHYLCKDLTVHRDETGRSWISDPRSGEKNPHQADWTWIRSGFFLRWVTDPNPDLPAQVTLICFGASRRLRQRFAHCLPPMSWKDSLDDPYSVFAVLFDEFSLQLDTTVWDVSRVFGGMETDTLRSTSSPSIQQDFAGLHNISKHIIYLEESSDAILLTLKNLRDQHQSIPRREDDQVQRTYRNTQRALMNTETGFQTASLRVKSLNKRMQNVIGLSFHVVTQDGNRIMQRDSRSMSTIAVVTLVFLPISTVSTIFGSQFFDFDDTALRLRVSTNFWIFWLISFPVTITVVAVWYYLHRRASRRLLELYRRKHDSLGGIDRLPKKVV